MKVSVSILDCDFLRLGEELRAVAAAGADAIHLDVMDGRFVSNLSFGVPLGRAVKRGTNLPIHTHLMVADPLGLLPGFVPFSDLIVFHLEVLSDPAQAIQAIRATGKQAGLSLNPDTPVAALKPHIPELDDVLVMSVFPGKGGQQFIPESLDRIRELRQMIDRAGSRTTISVDGGVSPANCADIARAGADILIAGSSVFRSKDYRATIQALKCSKP